MHNLFKLIVLIAISYSGSAFACPPGYIFREGGGVAGCQPTGNVGSYEEEPASDYAPPVVWKDLSAALVWWNDAGGKPKYSSARSIVNQSDAEAQAMQHCVSAGGKNCRVAFSFSNGFLAVARAGDGTLYAKSAGSKRDAKSLALDECTRGQGQKCKVDKVIESLPYQVYAN